MFCRHLLNNAELKPGLVARLDLGSTEEDREREILTFYKKTGIDWASPFSVILTGSYLSLNVFYCKICNKNSDYNFLTS